MGIAASKICYSPNVEARKFQFRCRGPEVWNEPLVSSHNLSVGFAADVRQLLHHVTPFLGRLDPLCQFFCKHSRGVDIHCSLSPVPVTKVLVDHLSLFSYSEVSVDSVWGVRKNGLECLRVSSSADCSSLAVEESHFDIEVASNLSLKARD